MDPLAPEAAAEAAAEAAERREAGRGRLVMQESEPQLMQEEGQVGGRVFSRCGKMG